MSTAATSSPVLEPAPRSATAPSALALRLGYAGLLPFVIGAALTWLVRPDAHPHVVDALAKYAALIVAFLGGIHWGLVMRDGVAQAGAASSPMADPPMTRAVPQVQVHTWSIAWGVLPSLLAWFAVVMPPFAGLALLGVWLIVCYVVDRRVYARLGLGAWMTLRFRLTAVASVCCFVAAAGS